MDADAWDERYRSMDLVWGAEPNRFVRAQCESLPVGEAVDLACGEGRNALWLARLGWHVTGIDYSPVAIERARDLTGRQPADVAIHVRWEVGDVTTEALRPRSVDLVLISYLHLPTSATEPLMQMAGRAVRTGGHLVIVGHDLRNLAEGVSGPQDPERLYEPEQVRRWLSQVEDLKIELCETVERSTDAGVALDTLVRARRTER